MIIEVLNCDICGKTHRIETDDQKFVDKCTKDFNKIHDKCKKRKKGD